MAKGSELSMLSRMGKYPGQIKVFLVVLVGTFIVALSIGYVTAQPFVRFVEKTLSGHSGEFSRYEQRIMKSLTTPSTSPKRGNLADPTLVKQTFRIFLHNTLAIGATVYLSLFVFFFPIIQKFTLGYLGGVVLRVDGWDRFLARITPHGFVELPLTFVVSSLAMLLGLGILKVSRGERKRTFLNNLRYATAVYLLSIPLSIIAAVLECYGRRLMWGT